MNSAACVTGSEQNSGKRFHLEDYTIQLRASKRCSLRGEGHVAALEMHACMYEHILIHSKMLHQMRHVSL